MKVAKSLSLEALTWMRIEQFMKDNDIEEVSAAADELLNDSLDRRKVLIK